MSYIYSPMTNVTRWRKYSLFS